MAIPGAKWIIFPCLLLVLLLVAYYVLQLVRNMAIGRSGSDDHLGSFRKMRDDGMIAPEEYKKLAGLVPLPETEAKEKPDPDETGVHALTEAAKSAIRKSAAQKSEEPAGENEDQENDQSDESAES